MKHVPMTIDLIIRRATSRDFSNISKLNDLTKRPQRTDSRFQEYFIAESGGDFVGCAAFRCRRDAGYLYGLTVHPSWRRRGIGHALTERRLEAVRSNGIRTTFVFAMFWNVKFFERHGFLVTPKSRTLELRWLHNDFEERWCRRSALLVLSLQALSPQSAAQ
jgi:N-acetylglutamate synthase-like GNAT family acetyltransferase